MEERKETFTYHYSSSQQAEIKEIREKYLPREQSKMDLLRRLDKSASRPGMAAAYPLYACIAKKQREKLAPEILRLTDELLK